MPKKVAEAVKPLLERGLEREVPGGFKVIIGKSMGQHALIVSQAPGHAENPTFFTLRIRDEVLADKVIRGLLESRKVRVHSQNMGREFHIFFEKR